MKTLNVIEDAQKFQIRALKGEATSIAVNFALMADRAGTSMSSAVWAVESGNATVGSDTEASNVSTALVTTGELGVSAIKVTATMANSEKKIALIKVLTQDISEYPLGDYWGYQ